MQGPYYGEYHNNRLFFSEYELEVSSTSLERNDRLAGLAGLQSVTGCNYSKHVFRADVQAGDINHLTGCMPVYYAASKDKESRIFPTKCFGDEAFARSWLGDEHKEVLCAFQMTNKVLRAGYRVDLATNRLRFFVKASTKAVNRVNERVVGRLPPLNDTLLDMAWPCDREPVIQLLYSPMRGHWIRVFKGRTIVHNAPGGEAPEPRFVQMGDPIVRSNEYFGEVKGKPVILRPYTKATGGKRRERKVKARKALLLKPDCLFMDAKPF